MPRFQLVAIGVLAAVALVAGGVAIALSASSDTKPAAATPTGSATPTDVAAGVDAGAGVAESVGRLTQDGIDRSYLVLAPTSVMPTTPLVVGLHGEGVTPGAEATRQGLLTNVAAGQALLVYPVGYGQAWNIDDGCCGRAAEQQLDDVAFVGMVVDAVRGRYGLTGPTDLVGFDNGGGLAFAAGCRDASRYAAVAVVGAAPTTSNCRQSDVPLPVFAGVSLDDDRLPSADHPEPPATVLAGLETTWLDRNGCIGSPSVTPAGQANVRTWTACEAGAVVETVTWRRGGHAWPSRATVGSPDAADLVWSFLSGVAQRAGK